jgi:GDP-4-dehydro-6-deoxy-D-mannose reductase
MPKMKILITGSNGFLGSHLIDQVLQEKCIVYGVDRPNSSFQNLVHYTNGKIIFDDSDKKRFCKHRILLKSNQKELSFLECDITNQNLLESIIQAIKPDYIFHFGAQPYVIQSWKDPVATMEVNVIGTINVFEPIKKHNLKTRVIVACSATEFGTSAMIGRPLKEDDPLLAVHPYGISKIATELLSRQYYLNFSIETINLRFFNLTGVRRKNDAPSDFIDTVAQIDLGLKEPILRVGNLNPYRDFLDVQDAVQAIWFSALKGKPGETYNVCSGKKTQIREILDWVLELSSKKIKVMKDEEKIRQTDENVIIGDNTKITSELGWSPKKALKSTIKEMYEEKIALYKESIN